LSTGTPIDSAADLLSATAADHAVMAVEELEEHTHGLAQRVATALAPTASAAGMELAAGPADVQDGAADLLPPGTVHGLIARVRDAAAVQVVLILDQSLAGASAAPVPGAQDPTAAELPEAWMAPLAGAMERWASDLGGVLVNAMPVADADQLQHLLVGSGTTTLMASGLFAGTSLVGSVAVVGRTSAEQTPSVDPARTGVLTGADALTGPAAAVAPADAPRRTQSAVLDAMHVLADVEMKVTAELGRTRMSVSDLLALTPGSLIELDRTAGSPIDLLVNGTLIARGEVVVVDEEYGIRLTEITGSES
jgi:flagellar motor switch protein FliN/FliY